jgi:SAM-dependent methyltransferase
VVARMTSTSELAASCYDRAASRFAAAADQHVYRLLADPLVKALHDTAATRIGNVLDVAAGTGAVGRSFPEVVALDVSVEQLRHNPSARRVRADGRHLPFRDASCVAAVCGFGINHVADPAALISEMARVAPVVGVCDPQGRLGSPHRPLTRDAQQLGHGLDVEGRTHHDCGPEELLDGWPTPADPSKDRAAQRLWEPHCPVGLGDPPQSFHDEQGVPARWNETTTRRA